MLLQMRVMVRRNNMEEERGSRKGPLPHQRLGIMVHQDQPQCSSCSSRGSGAMLVVVAAVVFSPEDAIEEHRELLLLGCMF